MLSYADAWQRDVATVFSDMITVTEKIEKYVADRHGGCLDGAIGSSLGSSFVGQLIQRENVHIDHGIFGSPDLDQSGRLSAWLQSKLVVPLLTSFAGSEEKQAKTKEKLKGLFEMLVVFIAAWELVVRTGVVPSFLLPAAGVVASKARTRYRLPPVTVTRGWSFREACAMSTLLD